MAPELLAWRREQAVNRAIVRAYEEAVGHAPPEPPAGMESAYRLQYGYGIPQVRGGYKQPPKRDRAIWIARLAAAGKEA